MSATTKLAFWHIHAEWSDTGQGGSLWLLGRRYQHVDGRKQDDKPEGVEFKPLGVIILANAIKDMGALLVLNLASNNLFAEGIELLAEALKGNQIMTELNVSGNAATWDGNKHGEMSGVIALADAIPDMGAMTSLDISNNSIGLIDIFLDGWRSKDNDGRAPFVHTGGRKQNAVPEGAKSSGVIAIANVIPDMRALSHFDISSNDLRTEGGKALPEALKGNQIMTALNVSSNALTYNTKAEPGKMDGLVALADAISDMGALTKLDACSNDIGDDGEDALKKAAGSR